MVTWPDWIKAQPKMAMTSATDEVLVGLKGAKVARFAKPTTLAAAGITNAYTSAQTDAAIAAAIATLDKIRGAYTDLSALSTAIPTGNTGDIAVLTHGSGSAATIAIWDTDNSPAAWIDTGSAIPTTLPWASITGKPTFGTASALDVGTTANKVVQLDGGGKLPAVDGSQITNLPVAVGAQSKIVANVKDFGAVGDGTTDDKTAIQAALTSLASTGGTLFFPSGTYLTSGGLTVPGNVKLTGSGPASVITCPSTGWLLSATTVAPYFGIFNVIGVSNVEISNLRISGTTTQNITHSPKLIYLESCDNVSIHDNKFGDTAYEGIWQGGTFTAVTNIKIKDNHLANVGGPNEFTGLPAIQCNMDTATISGNTLVNCGTAIGASGNNLTIRGNVITNPLLIGIGIGDQAIHDVVVSGNTIDLQEGTVPRYGIYCGSNTTGITIAGNNVSIVGPTSSRVASCIYLTGYAPYLIEAIVEGNFCTMATRGNGIHAINAVQKLSIRNNTVKVVADAGGYSSSGIVSYATDAGTAIDITSSGNRLFGFSDTGSYAIRHNYVSGTNKIAVNGDTIDSGGLGIKTVAGTVDYFTATGGTMSPLFVDPSSGYIGKLGYDQRIANSGITVGKMARFTSTAGAVGQSALSEDGSGNVTVTGLISASNAIRDATYNANVLNLGTNLGGQVQLKSNADGMLIDIQNDTSDLSFRTGSGSTTKMTLKNGGSLGIGTTSPACSVDANGAMRAKTYTVATLPAASLGSGMMAYVSDAATAWSAAAGGTVAGGGSNFSRVVSDGTNWKQM